MFQLIQADGRRCIILCFIASLFLLSSSLSAIDAYNIDFGNKKGEPASTYGAASGQLGIWNKVDTVGPTALLDISGANNGATITFNPTDSSYTFAGSTGTNNTSGGIAGDNELLADNYFRNTSGWSFDIDGLNPGQYDVYYYAASAGNKNSSVPINTGAVSANGLSAAQADILGSIILTNPLTQGLHYQVIQNVIVDGSNKLNVAVASGSFQGLSGLQVVPIPEPSTYLLLGSMVVFAVVTRRRKKRRKTII